MIKKYFIKKKLINKIVKINDLVIIYFIYIWKVSKTGGW